MKKKRITGRLRKKEADVKRNADIYRIERGELMMKQ